MPPAQGACRVIWAVLRLGRQEERQTREGSQWGTAQGQAARMRAGVCAPARMPSYCSAEGIRSCFFESCTGMHVGLFPRACLLRERTIPAPAFFLYQWCLSSTAQALRRRVWGRDCRRQPGADGRPFDAGLRRGSTWGRPSTCAAGSWCRPGAVLVHCCRAGRPPAAAAAPAQLLWAFSLCTAVLSVELGRLPAPAASVTNSAR
jgi:hypothetical protein